MAFVASTVLRCFYLFSPDRPWSGHFLSRAIGRFFDTYILGVFRLHVSLEVCGNWTWIVTFIALVIVFGCWSLFPIRFIFLWNILCFVCNFIAWWIRYQTIDWLYFSWENVKFDLIRSFTEIYFKSIINWMPKLPKSQTRAVSIENVESIFCFLVESIFIELFVEVSSFLFKLARRLDGVAFGQSSWSTAASGSASSGIDPIELISESTIQLSH